MVNCAKCGKQVDESKIPDPKRYGHKDWKGALCETCGIKKVTPGKRFKQEVEIDWGQNE